MHRSLAQVPAATGWQQLLQQCVTMASKQYTPLLPVKQPVPSDIEIAQSVEPVHIAKIADKLGLQQDEYELYGIHKAKVNDYSGYRWQGRFRIGLYASRRRRSAKRVHKMPNVIA